MAAKSHEFRLYPQLFVWLSCLMATLAAVELAGLCLIWANVNLNQFGIPLWWFGSFDFRIVVMTGIAAAITSIGGRRLRTLANQFADKAQRFRESDK